MLLFFLNGNNVVGLIYKVISVVSKLNMDGSNPREWWIDTGATRHVCFDRGIFKTFELVLD